MNSFKSKLATVFAITVMMLISLVAHAAFYCPSVSAFTYDVTNGEYRVPEGWCWSANKGNTKQCNHYVNHKITSFSGAFWTNELPQQTLNLAPLCFYNHVSRDTLYAQNQKFINHPSVNKTNWKLYVTGYACYSSNLADCPFKEE